MKHTKGPWKATKGHIGANIADFISCGVYDGIHITWGEKRFRHSSPESEANARLIAESPEMIRALIDIYDAYTNSVSSLSSMKSAIASSLEVIERAKGAAWSEIKEGLNER